MKKEFEGIYNFLMENNASLSKLKELAQSL
jgi:hypothetical protein